MVTVFWSFLCDIFELDVETDKINVQLVSCEPFSDNREVVFDICSTHL